MLRRTVSGGAVHLQTVSSKRHVKWGRFKLSLADRPDLQLVLPTVGADL